MLILDVIEHETIWGGQRLAQNACENKRIGHLYSIITTTEMTSKIINGSYAGETFRDYFKENKSKLGMSEYDEFPFVVALVEAHDNLSIQVHPDDKTAQELENQRHGKNESWFFLTAPINGQIYNGCVCKNKNELRDRINSAEVDGLTDTLTVKTGDYVYIEAGTLHAMTGGSLVYEIEENCNLTYRFYDFNRIDTQGLHRELHIEKAIQSVDVKKKSIIKRYSEDKPIVERRYSTQLLKNITTYENAGTELACFTLIDGCFALDGINITPGMSILLMPGEQFGCDATTAIVARPRLTNM